MFMSKAFRVAPILSSDGSVLYLAGANTELYCIDATSGDVLWSSNAELRSSILAEPRLMELYDDPKVFVIEAMNGKVRQHNALTGALDWEFGCLEVSGIPCNDAVEAEFSVAPSGNVIFYGDIFGKIVALEVAAFDTNGPTVTETVPPTTPQEEEEKKEEEKEEEEEEQEVIEEAKNTHRPTPRPTPALLDGGAVVWGKESDSETESTETESTEIALDSQTETEYETSASTAGGDDAVDSFFSNEIMIILVAVCGGLAFAIIVLLVAQKMRTQKQFMAAKDESEGTVEDGKKWTNAMDEYEEECRRDEEETLREIVAVAPKTPGKPGKKKSPNNKKKFSPLTPATLASIEESPAECELSLVSDVTPKDLEKSFEKLLDEKKEDDGSTSMPVLPAPQAAESPIETNDDNNSNVESTGPPDLSCVEVVVSPPTQIPQQPSPADNKRPVSPDYTANDVMSLDGSLYLDDDSLYQARVEVASLSQFSMASSRDTEMDTPNPMDEGQTRFEPASIGITGAHYLQPPSRASPVLSPQVANYLHRNASPLSHDSATTPEGHVRPIQTSPLSTSPVTPPSNGNSPEETGSGRFVARAGQSVRQQGSGNQRGRSRETSPPIDPDETINNNRVEAPPLPPLQTEAEPEDAWSSFLSELAKAEREFFNPSFGKKKKQERATSPPPPPPPDSPPDSPAPDPPAASRDRRRHQ
jgi:hypothetical protein